MADPLVAACLLRAFQLNFKTCLICSKLSHQLLTELPTTRKRQSNLHLEFGLKSWLCYLQGREFVWDSKNTFTGVDHYCCDAGSGEVLCYFRSTFLPLKKEGGDYN